MKLEDIRIDTYRSGGTSIRQEDLAVRVTHLPTGITKTCDYCPTQRQNYEEAFRHVQLAVARYEIEVNGDKENQLREIDIELEKLNKHGDIF